VVNFPVERWQLESYRFSFTTYFCWVWHTIEGTAAPADVGHY